MWLTRVSENIAHLVDFLDHYRAELGQSRVETSIKGNEEKIYVV